MEATAAENPQPSGEVAGPVPPARTPGVSDDAPEGVHRAAAGQEVSDAEEHDAIDWFLGKTQRPFADVPVTLWTPRGDLKMMVRIQALDGSRIQQVDSEHRTGTGPFATIDKVGFAAQLVAESAVHFRTDRRTVTLDDPSFSGGAPGGKAGAVRIRFKYQEGLLESLADRVQDLSAYSSDRVGAAQRVLVDAAGNS